MVRMKTVHGASGPRVAKQAILWSIATWPVLLLGLAPLFAAEEQAAAEALAKPSFDFVQLNAQIQSALQRANPACVAAAQRQGRRTGASFSAVIVSQEGHLLTAAHCVQPGADYVITLDDGRRFDAKALGSSPMLDCGMIKIADGKDLPWAELGRSAELVPDQPCLSISHPNGLDAKRGLVIRFGRVVGRNRRGHIHNTCLMEPGDSGGGLFDLEGRVIGIHSHIERDLSDNFDIPIDWFREYWEQLCEAGEFNPPMGIARFGIILKSNRVPEEGVEVAEVTEDSPAADAGLKAGDVITAVNGNRLMPKYDMNRAWRRLMPRGGRGLTLTLRGDDESQTLFVKSPASRHSAVSGEPSAEYDVFEDLAANLSALEGKLDDCTVRITSTKGKRQLSLLGTVISRGGLIVSKSSDVGESPAVVDHRHRTVPGKIVARDEDSDLVLLQVDRPLEQPVDLANSIERIKGVILLSPRPGDTTGLVSVVGSRAFPSARQTPIGFMGVTLELRDDGVALKTVGDGPAKKAGLKPNDVVLKLDGQRIAAMDELVNAVRSHPPGQEVRVTIRRGADEKVIDVTLGSRPHNSGMHVADSFAGGSSLRRTGFEAIFCHDAHAKPDECGGPVFDTQGNFVGINIARFSRTCCYAMPADVMWKSVERLHKQTLQTKNATVDDALLPND